MWRVLFVPTLAFMYKHPGIRFCRAISCEAFTLDFLLYLPTVILSIALLSPFALQSIPHYGAEKLMSNFFPCEYSMPAKTYTQNINGSTNGKMSYQIMSYL